MSDDANDPEGRVGAFRKMLRIDGYDRYLDPEVQLRLAGADLAPGHAPGCVATIDPARLRVYYKPVGPRTVVVRTMAHEGGHLVVALTGGDQRHPEPYFSDVGSALLLPREVMTAALKRVGWDAVGLALEFPEVPPAVIYRRAAEVRGGVAVVRNRRRRAVYGPEHLVSSVARWERELLHAADARGHRNLWGMGAWRFERPRPWSVILVPPTAIDMLPTAA